MGVRRFARPVHHVPKRDPPSPLPQPHGTAPWERPAHVDGRIKEVTKADLKVQRRVEKNRGNRPVRIKPIKPVRLHDKFIYYEKKGRLASLQGAVLQYAPQLDGACVAAALRALAIRNRELSPNHRRVFGMPDRVLDTLTYATDVRLREKSFRPKYVAMLLDGMAKLKINPAEHAPNGEPLSDLIRAEVEASAPHTKAMWISDMVWGCLRHDIQLSDEALRAFCNTFAESRFKGISHFHVISGFQNMIKMVEQRGGSREEVRALMPDTMSSSLCESITFRKNLKIAHIEALMDLFDYLDFKFDQPVAVFVEERFDAVELDEEHPLWERLAAMRPPLTEDKP
ncbi:Hypothetical Protein FCC1311_085682 [Hondaea fermentalgiana]|uniref:Uncharacterized protein n=1 Tax=Hondaea fermentalgiana TaxID=2315210 RepID=A0A2R5GUK4_9STRA|nr:Hypothetical Protein FCC1311_085682 [Hondaea fermentalgiana]|eukprot:GBG32343.1 Hypothetical Protein FCC1311_085682 [Hondaea fermentalgiana]